MRFTSAIYLCLSADPSPLMTNSQEAARPGQFSNLDEYKGQSWLVNRHLL